MHDVYDFQELWLYRLLVKYKIHYVMYVILRASVREVTCLYAASIYGAQGEVNGEHSLTALMLANQRPVPTVTDAPVGKKVAAVSVTLCHFSAKNRPYIDFMNYIYMFHD